jgi:hypothetical protein
MFIVRPIVWRELLRESRHRTHFGGRALIAIILGAIVLSVGLSLNGPAPGPSGVLMRGGIRPGGGPPPSYYPIPPSPIASVQANMARLGTQLFTIWAIGQYFALCALGTVRAASLAQERRADRLPLLTITGLGGRGVILGTYASILVRALFTMLLMLPILALARGFGGFTAGQACLAAGMAFVAAAYAAALTLALASLVSGTAAAVVLSAVVQAILMAVFYVWLVQTAFARSGPPGNSLSHQLSWVLIHSFGLLTAVVRGTLPPWNVLAFYAFARALLCFVCLKLAMVLTQRPAADPGRHLKHALMAMDRYFLHFTGFGKRVLWKSGLGECRGNPIYWRERAISVVGQRDHMIRVLYGSAVLLSIVLTVALVTDWADISGKLAVIGVIGVPLLLAGLLMLVQPALAFAREKERGGLDALVVTPMTPRQFVMGKYWYALRSVAVPLGIGLGFWCLVAAFGPSGEIGSEVWSVVAVVLMVPLAVAMILYVAAGARSAVGGILGGVAVLVGLGLLAWFLRLLRMYDNVPPTLVMLVQYLLMASMVDRGVPFSPSGGCCAFLLLLCSFLTAPYSKWMRNGLVIALFVLIPLLLGHNADELLPSSMMLAIPVALAVYMGIRLKKFHVAVLVAAGAGLMYAGGEALPLFFIPCILLLACWRAARYADYGVFNRAFVAVALVGSTFSVLAIALYPSRGDLPPPILLVGGGVAAFLFFTIRQFDRLVERNG